MRLVSVRPDIVITGLEPKRRFVLQVNDGFMNIGSGPSGEVRIPCPVEAGDVVVRIDGEAVQA